MGATKVLLLLMLLFNFTSPLSFAHITNNSGFETFNSTSRDDNGVINQIDESNGFVSRDDNGVLNQIKFSHASAKGGGSGGSGSSRRGGGGALIPVYAASGAASKPNNHHNAANTCNMCRKDRLLFVGVTILTSTLLRMYI
ncbi:hypothetical protein SSX86_020538 [Deinandra increscens subsp. villosa]|uniref:Glycine-rich protein n=1 Tax=Deinandra increscens subsp. villosa TaxID=3103831 RepID=A0AAP0GTJ4_9ASTR